MKICPTCHEMFEDSKNLCPTDGTALEPMITQAEDLVGELLSGKYKLRSILGKGGMGAVFDGEHIQLGRPVAVKMIHPMFLCPESVTRFQREAKVASSLNHPNVIQIYDFGQAEDGSLYLVMEKLQGQELKDEITRNGSMEVNRAIRLFAQICDGMAVAHAQNMIHRDLKPQNVMLVRDSRGNEQIKILDFGLARTMDSNRTALTEPGTVMGSPQYMSPEQISGQEVTKASDIYAMGLIFYEMLAGTPAFTGKNASEIFKAHLTEKPKPLQPENAPRELNEVVMRCLAKEPQDRFASVDKLMATLPQTLASTTMPYPAASAAVPEAPSDNTTRPDPKEKSKTLARTTPSASHAAKALADTGKDTPDSDSSKSPSKSSSNILILVGVMGGLCLLLSMGALGAFLVFKSFQNKGSTKTSEIGKIYDVKPAGSYAQEETRTAVDRDLEDAYAAVKQLREESTALVDESAFVEDSLVHDSDLILAQETKEPVQESQPAQRIPAAQDIQPVKPAPEPIQQPLMRPLQPQQPTAPPPVVLPQRPKVFVEVVGDPMVTQYLRKELYDQLRNLGCPLSTSREDCHMVVQVQAELESQKTTHDFGTRFNLKTYAVLISAEALPWRETWPNQVMDVITLDPTYAATKLPHEAQRVTKGLVSKLMDFWDEKLGSSSNQ